MASLASSVAELTKVFSGRLIEPGVPAYEEVRRIHNGMIDKRPALIASCRGTADIADAIALAHAEGLEIAVRGGGHNVAGRSCVEGGLMIDLSLMRHVTVDPGLRVAWAGGGALWREFNRETQQFALATTGGIVSSTGVAGLTLGGGFGWLMPRFGMALDNLRSVTLVLADGSVVRASATEHPDLFWAVRGGGGNFGVASTFEFDLHEVGPIVTGGLVAHPAVRVTEVLKFFREQTIDLPDEAFVVAALLTAPDGSGAKIVGIAAQHSGPVQAGEAFVKPLKAFGPPVIDMMGPMPYIVSNMMLDDSFKRGARNYWKSHFLPELTDGAIDVLAGLLETLPTSLSQIVIENFHGAATRVPVTDTAYALRECGYNVVIAAQWMDAADDERCMTWCRNAFQTLQPFVGQRRYVNYLGEDDMQESASLLAAYGPNLQRLRTIKRLYDPNNVFHHNLNIPPA